MTNSFWQYFHIDPDMAIQVLFDERGARLKKVSPRSFSLPSSIDAEHVAAEYKGGQLILSMPKRKKPMIRIEQRRNRDL